MIQKLLPKALLFFLLALFAASCVSKKDLVYLQEKDLATSQDTTMSYQRREYQLQVNDIVDVKVRSMNPEANTLFDGGGNNNQNMNAGIRSGGDIYYMTGYSVNDSGYIDLPVLGLIEVEGLTIPETKKAIRKQVEKYYSKYYLRVQLGGIRYSALGEFNRAGKYTALQNQLTIFEAIANAGDLNTVADRDRVQIIRQYPDGTKIHTIDLLDRNIIHSPYYFIQPNDIIYVEPLQRKTLGFGINAASTLTTLVSILSSGLALILAIQGL
jgi:polysaccharide export outer membrane protein